MIAGKYRLNQLLGMGGMATVWSATNIFTEREFAIKFLLEGIAKSPEAARRFLMEGKISGRVQHPNVIEVMDIGQTEDGMLFLVMELLSGVSLEVAIRRQHPPMTVYEFVGIMLDVARALLAAHRGGVVHRDLKPSNIYLHKDREGIAVPKVLDFGVSKFLLEDDRDNALTIAGTVLGSPLYMSPEQAMGATDVDHRSDIFAFGAILFEGLCGFRCYDAPNFNALLVTIATQQPKFVNDYVPDLIEGLRAVVRDCLVTDRNQRLQTMEAVIERLAAQLPELEQLPLRLAPCVSSSATLSDPDATNAMPAIVRPSDRPPAYYEDLRTSMPPPAFSATPHMQRRNTSQPAMLFIGGGIVLATMAAVVLALVWVARSTQLPQGSSPAALVASAPPSAIAPAQLAPADPPSVSVDALPAGKPAQPKGSGKLWVSAAPDWCNITIDGKDFGPTPITDVELSAGPHAVRCIKAGKTDGVTITITAGATTKQKFQLAP